MAARHPRTRLTEAKVRSIINLYFDKLWSQERIAKKFGVGRSTVGDIIRGRSWKRVHVVG